MKKQVLKTAEYTAPTIEEAKKLACTDMGATENEIVFKILEQPKKSLFGKLKGEAKVEATLYGTSSDKPVTPTPEPVPKPTPETVKTEPEPTPTEPPKDITPEKVTPTEPLTEEITPKKKVPQKATPVPPADYPDASTGIETEPVEETYTDETMPAHLAITKDYVTEVYKKMGADVEISVVRTKSGIRMEPHPLGSTRSGAIIGRRGETLDSIQYLASIVANKHSDEYCRLMLDTNGYRAKRRQTLEALAEKIAHNVQRSGRATTLEPMNPYERRIIHSRVATIDGVTSHSTGEDPYRKVIISSTNPPRRNNRNNYHGNNRGNNQRNGRPHQNNHPRDRKPEDFHRNDLGSLKTSFERDYKKPKPEDSLSNDFYGKIDI